MDSEDLRSVLRNQDGIVSRTQARVAGLTGRQIDARLRRGDWIRHAPGVYRDAGHELTERAAIIASALWLGPDAVLAGRSAARWWGMPVRPPGRLQFVARKRCRSSSSPRVDVQRVYVASVDRVTHRGVSVVSRALAVVRAAVELEDVRPGEGLALLDRSFQLGVRPAEIESVLRRYRGARGNQAAWKLLALTAAGGESHGERRLGELLRDAGIHGWVYGLAVQAGGRQYRLDIAFEALRVAIEFDGFGFHVDRDRFVTDRRRGNDLTAAGWLVIHVTWDDLVSRPEETLLRIVQILRQRVGNQLPLR